MSRKAILAALFLAVASSAAWAQTPKVEFTGLIGYSLTDGVTGDPYRAGNGKTYDAVDLKDSMMYGFSVGFYLTPSAEVGFLWRRQPSTVEISGTSGTDTLGDISIDGYHGYGAYYFGDPENKVHPYIMGGLGITHYGSVAYTKSTGQAASTTANSQFSTTWGAGVKVNASKNVGVKFGIEWTPTYIKSDAAGMWCDPWWGCYVVGNAQYSNQFEFQGGIAFRF